MKVLILLTAILLLGACATAPSLEEKIAGTSKITEEWPDDRVGIITDQGKGVVYYAQNKEETEITLTLNINVDNMLCDKGLPYTVIVPPKRKLRLCILSVQDRNKRWNCKYNWEWLYGTPAAKHDNDYIYALPYPKGKSFEVTQGYNGKFSHFGNDYNSLDWGMPVGSQVCAARGGTVIAVREDSSKSGLNKKLYREANYICIKHKDETIGEYMHLKKNGAYVDVGQHVEKGQVIGLSGNTGYTSAPHLHLTVYKPISGKKRENYKVKFLTKNGNGILLKEGDTYTSW